MLRSCRVIEAAATLCAGFNHHNNCVRSSRIRYIIQTMITTCATLARISSGPGTSTYGVLLPTSSLLLGKRCTCKHQPQGC